MCAYGSGWSNVAKGLWILQAWPQQMQGRRQGKRDKGRPGYCSRHGLQAVPVPDYHDILGLHTRVNNWWWFHCWWHGHRQGGHAIRTFLIHFKYWPNDYDSPSPLRSSYIWTSCSVSSIRRSRKSGRDSQPSLISREGVVISLNTLSRNHKPRDSAALPWIPAWSSVPASIMAPCLNSCPVLAHSFWFLCQT